MTKAERIRTKSTGWWKALSDKRQHKRLSDTDSDFDTGSRLPDEVIDVVRREGLLADEAVLPETAIRYPEAGDPVIVKRPNGKRCPGVLVKRHGRYCWVRFGKRVITEDIAFVRLNR